jgi:hypothetical protein
MELDEFEYGSELVQSRVNVVLTTPYHLR